MCVFFLFFLHGKWKSTHSDPITLKELHPMFSSLDYNIKRFCLPTLTLISLVHSNQLLSPLLRTVCPNLQFLEKSTKSNHGFSLATPCTHKAKDYWPVWRKEELTRCFSQLISLFLVSFASRRPAGFIQHLEWCHVTEGPWSRNATITAPSSRLKPLSPTTDCTPVSQPPPVISALSPGQGHHSCHMTHSVEP